MEFEKHEKGRLFNKNLEEKLTVSSGESEAKPLIFTFVPTVRRLPTHSQLADTSKFLVKIPEESSDKNPETINRSNSNDYLSLNAGSHQERDLGTLTCPLEISGTISQGRGFQANELQGMQQSGLFKAEYVFIVDSEGEDEDTIKRGDQSSSEGKGAGAVRPKSLAISSDLVSDVVRPKTSRPDLQAPAHPEMPHGTAPQQKLGQLTSPTTSEQLACKPPAFSFVSPTNQKTQPDPVNHGRASVLEELHTRRMDGSGVFVEETATYFQTTAHTSPSLASKGTSSRLQSSPTQLPGSNLSSPNTADQKLGLTPEVLKKTMTLTSHVLNPRESLRTSPSLSSGASLKLNTASYIPVRIVTHSLSPSPQPFTSTFQGSSSTLCSSQMSSSGNLSKSGGKSPVPSRLSLLTAILKSNPSHQRPFSPASCPTFSLNSLASSTLTLDQKVKQTPPTPKKSLSSCCLRAESPEQGGHHVSEFSQQSFHLPIFTKSSPFSLTPSLSPTKQASSSLVSSSVEKIPSPTSLKSNTLSLLQTNTLSSVRLPPVPPSSSPLSPLKGKQDADLRDLENPRRLHIPLSTSAFSASSSISSPTNQRATLSSPEKCFQPSSALSNLINRSKSASSQLSGQAKNPSISPSPPISSSSSASLPNLGSFSLPHANLSTQALQLNPSALPSNFGSKTLPSKPGKTESTICDHRSFLSNPSPPISLTRTKKLISPCALSMSTDPENRKPKQYKTKSSYKAFAAIPTNIFLLEQKALDEPVKNESVFRDNALDSPLEYSSEFPSSSPKSLFGSDTIKMPATLPRAAGRETKYANLASPSSTISESQLTKPGVIRPAPVKSKIFLKTDEEFYEPNPFSKYLEEDSDLSSHQQ